MALATIAGFLVHGLGVAAYAVPHLFLSPAVSSIDPGGSVEIEVFIQDVADLRLYEVVLEVTGGASGSLNLTDLSIDETRGDFVFTGISPLICIPDPGNLRITCSPLSDDCVGVGTPPAYLGTYTFTASFDLRGRFNISIVDEPASFLLDCSGEAITQFTVADASVEIENPIPAVSEWSLVVMALLVLISGTLVHRRRRPARA